MLIILVDLLVAALLVLTAAYAIRKLINQQKEAKIKAALVRQQDADHMAQLVKELNPKKIKENEAKVQETLSKLQ